MAPSGKISEAELTIEEMQPGLNVFNFTSYQSDLADFLITDSKIQQEQLLNKTFVATYKPTGQVIGYVSLSTASIDLHRSKHFRQKF